MSDDGHQRSGRRGPLARVTSAGTVPVGCIAENPGVEDLAGRINVKGVVGRIDGNPAVLLEQVDPNPRLGRVDLDDVPAHVDVDALVPRLNPGALIAHHWGRRPAPAAPLTEWFDGHKDAV